MKKYLEYLRKINPFCEDKNYTYLITLIINYVKGNIRDYELIKKTKEEDLFILLILINQLINFNDEKVKYFIELPNANFETNYPKCILVGQINSYEIFSNFFNTLGPKYMKKNNRFFYDENLVQIEGDFSKIPNGAMLTTSDYYKIISKFPDLYNYMIDTINNPFAFYLKPQSDEEIIELTKKKISQGINTKEHNSPSENWIIGAYQTQLTEKIINSITFVNPITLSTEELTEGNFGTFESLIHPEEKHNGKLLYFHKK